MIDANLLNKFRTDLEKVQKKMQGNLSHLSNFKMPEVKLTKFVNLHGKKGMAKLIGNKIVIEFAGDADAAHVIEKMK